MTKYSEYKSISRKLKMYQFNKFRIRKMNTIYFNLRAFSRIISLNKTRKIDVIFLFRFSYYEVLIPTILNFIFKIPILIIAPTDFDTEDREFISARSNSITSRMFYYGWMKFFKNYLIQRKHVYIQAINQHVFNDLIDLNVSKKNIALIPIGINVDNFKDIRKIKHNETNFGFVGRLIKTKNIRFLIKTFKKYLNHFPNDRLLIYGSGPEEDFILKYIKSNSLKNKILLMGFEENKVKIYSKLDALIHPSYGEGLPNIILEAALTNTFIIASNVKGNRDIIKHKKTGFLFNPFDQNDLLDKLLLFKNDKNLTVKIIEKTKKFVISNYSINNVVDSIYDFIKSNIRS